MGAVYRFRFALTYFNRLVRGILLKGCGWQDIWQNLWPIAAFTAALMGVAVRASGARSTSPASLSGWLRQAASATGNRQQRRRAESRREGHPARQ